MRLGLYRRWGAGLRLITVSVPDAPGFLQGIRALFLTDLHVRRSTSDGALNDLVRVAQAARPDIVLMGGDYAEGGDPLARCLGALSAIPAPLGAYGCLGNNDRELRDALERGSDASWPRILVNETADVAVNGGILRITGLDERHGGNPREDALPPGGPGIYRVLLAHYPVLPGAEAARMPEMMLCGHTHGGQFSLFGLTPYSLPGFEDRVMPGGPALVRGTRRFGQTLLTVSNGVGFSRIRLRVGAEPQIHLIQF